MSVNPGFGGQKFIPRSLQKVGAVRAMLDRAGNRGALVEIDGGIDVSNIARAVDAGVDIVVAGSAIFGAPDPTAATAALKAAAAAAVAS
jgi:ribulose-phosphate 3-epimerase